MISTLFSSRKFVVALGTVLIASAFNLAGHVTADQLVDVLKFVAGSFIAATALEDWAQKKANGVI